MATQVGRFFSRPYQQACSRPCQLSAQILAQLIRSLKQLDLENQATSDFALGWASGSFYPAEFT